MIASAANGNRSAHLRGRNAIGIARIATQITADSFDSNARQNATNDPAYHIYVARAAEPAVLPSFRNGRAETTLGSAGLTARATSRNRIHKRNVVRPNSTSSGSVE